MNINVVVVVYNITLLYNTVYFPHSIHVYLKYIIIILTYFLFSHPGIGLLGITVEQLQVHALLIEDSAFFPQVKQARLLVGQCHKLPHTISIFTKFMPLN